MSTHTHTQTLIPIKLHRHHFRDIPVAITGISLGFITLGNLWGDLGAIWIKDFANLFAVIAVTLMLTKICLHPQKSFEEMQHHMIGSFYPTIGMTLMVFSNFVATSLNLTIGRCIWWIGIIIFTILAVLFISAQAKDFSWDNVLPSWFVPTVGIGVAAVTSGAVKMAHFSRIFFFIAFFVYLFTLASFIYRVASHGRVCEDKKLTVAVLAAPPSVCLAGYMATTTTPSPVILCILVPLALISTFYVYTLIPKFLRIPFHPGLAPLTFPLAVGSVAIQRFTNYLASTNSMFSTLFYQVFYIEFFIATLVIGYIVYKLLILIFHSLLNLSRDSMIH